MMFWLGRAEIDKARNMAQSMIVLAGVDEHRFSQAAVDLLRSGRKQEAIAFLEKTRHAWRTPKKALP
jgi:hypothetical protein